MEKRCINCKAYDELDENVGYCRRHAPKSLVASLDAPLDKKCGTFFPVVFWDDWCLEFIPKVSQEDNHD
jgi:hypothetical protein